MAHQSSSPALHLLPNPPLSAEKLTTTTPSPVTKPALRRPALYRGVELRDSSRAMQGAKAGANTVLEPPVDPLEENYLARSTLPSGMRKMSTTKGPSISPLLTGAHPVSQFQPASPVTPGPHTPLSTSSLSPNYSKDTHPGIPFPREPASPRTILTPPADPQIELALRVDATRISLGRYDIEQDLTFSVRVENAVADDVEVQLVTTKEGAETVYELKIRKKDPYGMRVRDGIIPYTYVPPFSSVSSSLGWSSMCSSPVTTPPLEVPPFHQYGSYFPSQYVSGGMWRTPKRASISKGSRSSRASSSTVRTPTASFRHYSPTTVFPVGHTLLPSSPAGKAAEARIALTQYDSDADDSDDGESVLDHYARRPAYSAPTLSPSVSVREPGVQYRHEIARNDGSLLGDNVSASYENANGMKVITDGYPGLKSHFSDTEAEGETEIEGGDSSDEVVLPAEIRQ